MPDGFGVDFILEALHGHVRLRLYFIRFMRMCSCIYGLALIINSQVVPGADGCSREM